MNHVIDAKERSLAIDPFRSYLVQAPAGSGKTELLVQRILALLATVDEPEEVLALTFTRKAAAEMRERVLIALHKAQQTKPQESHALTTWNLANKVLEQSDLKGWRLLSYPAKLRIMTIDAFASGLARQLPILSGFGQTPSTADFSEPLYQSAVGDLLQYTSHRHAPATLKQAMDTLILHLDCNIEKLNKLLCLMLSRREQWLPDVLKHHTDMHSFKLHLEACLQAVIEHHLFEAYEQLPENLKGQLPALACFAETQLSLLKEEQAHVLSPVQGITTFPSPDLSALEQWKACIHLLLTKNDAKARKSPTKNEGFPAGKDFKAQKDEMKVLLSWLENDDTLLNQLHNIRLLPDSATFDDETWHVLEALFVVLKTLAAQLWQTFEQHKKVDFVEVMLRAKQALGQENSAGEIIPSEALLRLDYQIKHILVDEFQDTSTLQIDLLTRLTAGWESDENNLGRTLFMVGDPMQSIYRFRKAEVSLFLRAANNELRLPFVTSLHLSQNFRSSPTIVDWVNNTFSHILPKNDDIFAGAIAYKPSQAFHVETGKVCLNIFKQRNDNDESAHIINIIRQAEGRNIGILARSRSHLHTIMQTLQEENISFHALDMLPLNKQPEIMDLRSLTCSLLHPCDQVAWAALLRSPAVGLPLHILHQVFKDKPLSIWSAIQHHANKTVGPEEDKCLQHFIHAMSPALQQVNRIPLRKLVESTWLNLSVPSILNPTQLANTDAFFELLESIEDEGNLDIQLLDSRLEKLFAKPESHAEPAHIELLTMHGAKGLQWDTVIIPGLGKIPRAKDKEVLVQTETNTHQGKQLLLAPLPHHGQEQTYALVRDFEKQRDALEVARLLYVACTRAERALHLFGHLTGKQDEEKPASSSLLALMWQDMEGCYGAEIKVHNADRTQDYTAAVTPAAQRINSSYLAPKPEPSICPSINHHADVINHKPKFSWAGHTARAVGIALHAALESVAEQGIEHWQEQHNKQSMRMMRTTLLHEGISQHHLDEALQRCFQGLINCLSSQKAQWILSHQHQEQHNEWALTYMEGSVSKHIVLDRSFIDAQGTRWVIDYKTGGHEGAGLDNFLDHELIRYTEETPQLPNYVKALQALEPHRDIKAALYFPMVDGWRVWNNAS